MSNEDMSDIMQKLSSMINSSNTDENSKYTNDDVSSNSNQFNMDNLKEFINNFQNSSQEDNTNINDDSNNSNNNSNNFNFDINTMMKMKSIMDKMNSSRNDPRSNLLQSLKPYLNNNRKERLDQYMQFLNISKVLEAFNSEGGVNSKLCITILILDIRLIKTIIGILTRVLL